MKKLHLPIWLRRNWLSVLDIIKTIMLGVLLIIGINGLGRAVVLSQQNQNLTQQVKSLADQNKQLSLQNKQLLQQLKDGNISIHQQINCVLSFFAQPPQTRTNSSIAQPIPCLITSSSGGAAGGTKSL